MNDPYAVLLTIRERLNNSTADMQQALTEIADLKDALAQWECKQKAQKTAWVSVKDGMPEDDERVVVRTKDGATYFLHPIGGKFPADITQWFRLPN